MEMGPGGGPRRDASGGRSVVCWVSELVWPRKRKVVGGGCWVAGDACDPDCAGRVSAHTKMSSFRRSQRVEGVVTAVCRKSLSYSIYTLWADSARKHGHQSLILDEWKG